MKIIYPIDIHLDRRVPCPILDAVQGECGRAVAVSLFKDSQPWAIPTGAHVVVRYARPDACGGVYDTLPDGGTACAVLDNVITAQLVPQALAVAGMVSVQLAITSAGAQLATFIFLVRVEPDPSVGTAAGEEYVNLLPQVVQGIADAKEAAMVAKAYAEKAKMTAASISTRYQLTYTAHALDAQTGAAVSSDKAIASNLFPLIGGKIGVTFSTLVRVRLFLFDRNMNLVWVDTEQTEPFEYADLPGAFARLEVSYNGNNTVPDVQALADEVSVYIPNTSAQDADDAEAAAQRAEAAAQRAENAAPDGVGGAAALQPLYIRQQLLTGQVDRPTYDGSQPGALTLPLGFTHLANFETIEGHIQNMPGILTGKFFPASYAEEEYEFQFAYAFAADPTYGKLVMVLDPAQNKIWHFEFGEDSYTVKETVIGEGAELQPLTFTGAVEATYDGTTPITVDIPTGNSGGGGFEELLRFTTTEAVTSFNVPIGSDENLEKLKNASEIIMSIYCPRNAEDTETNTVGKISVKAYLTSWLELLIGDINNAIPNPTETWQKESYTHIRFFAVPTEDSDGTMVCLYGAVQTNNAGSNGTFRHGMQWNKKILKATDYLQIVGSQNMAAGTRFILGVR